MNEVKTFHASPILKSKLYPPPVTPDLVPRLELLQRLERNRQRPVTLISAPAGYGKSVLASMWLEASGLPGGWLSLDGADNDLHTFAAYLLAAIETAVPHRSFQTQTLLNTSALPPVAVLARYLLADLEQIDTPFLLIVDDIHHIHQQSIFDFLEALLKHPAPVLNLVLVGRQDPPLPIASMRAYQRITEIRSRHLRFSPDETARFLQQRLNRPVSEEVAAEWAQNTEGWPVALRLAALSLHHRPQSADLKIHIPGNNQFLQEYLMAEVLTRLPSSLQSYLLKTAMLDRFCASLCEAVCLDAHDDSQTEMAGELFIQWLQKSNLFLIKLDHENVWFRFHHLFQSYLRHMAERQLRPPEIKTLYLRASQWFSENGYISEAIQHALAAGDVSTAVEIFAPHRRAAMNAGRWSDLERWIRLYPEDIVEREPALFVTRVYLPLTHYDLESVLTNAEGLLAAMPEDSPLTKELWADLSYLTGIKALFMGQSATTIAAGNTMTNTLPPDAFFLRTRALFLQGMGHQMAGNIKQGIHIIQDALSAPDWPVNSLARLFLDQAIIYFVEADLASAQILAGESIQLALKHNLLDTVFEARYIAGITSYLCNDLEMAETHLLAMVEHPVLMDDALAHATCTLSRLYQAQGQPEKANAIIQQIRSYLEEANNSFSLNLLESFQIELALDQGDVVRASRLSLTIPFNQQRPIRYHYYLPQLPPLKLWLAEGQELEQALTLLEEIDGHLCKMNRKVHRIDVLALQALAYQALDDVPMAMEKLGQSVALAAPGKFIRNYLDLGPKMRMLLEQLYNRTKKVDGTKYLPYLSQLVDAFPPVKAEEQKSVSPPSILIDHLTERELQTLGLLATDLSTKEIAAEMNVTWATTRTHIKNIYGKLGVHGRYEAVQHAQKMGLL